MKKHYLVLGNGPLGLWTAAALLVEPEVRVSILSRSGKPSWVPKILDTEGDRVEWPRGNVKNTDELRSLSQGTSAIIHCVNPAYFEWQSELPIIYDSVTKVAVEGKIRLVTSENLYMFKVPSKGPITENAEFSAQSKKGGYRLKEIEKMMALSKQGLLEFSSIHASDYLGPGATWQSHFGTRFFEPLARGKSPQFVGRIDTKRSYVYTVDFGRALALLATTDDKSLMGRGWILEPLVSKSTLEIANDFIQKGTEAKVIKEGFKAKIGVLPPSMLKVLGLFNKTIKELPEMLYQWDSDFVSSGRAFIEKTNFKPSGYDQALGHTIQFFRESLAQK